MNQEVDLIDTLVTELHGMGSMVLAKPAMMRM
jgi:hypothetical protein